MSTSECPTVTPTAKLSTCSAKGRLVTSDIGRLRVNVLSIIPRSRNETGTGFPGQTAALRLPMSKLAA